MRSLRRALVTVCGLMIVPAAAFAQATLAGTVKDPTGAVLPGVTIEASSPVLIEKTRTALTDGAGQYRIESLQPGTLPSEYTRPSRQKRQTNLLRTRRRGRVR